ncbi:MAG: F0F1 ATP synthase subunit A [Bacteroidetes bacterium]|nr:F0F1 ATP synthase subunit A [Bacteroidota bacterium]
MIRVLIINALILLSFFLCNGNEITEKESGKANKTEEKAFNAGEMIIEHIVDAHEWHIMKIGETDISISLPVILYDNGKLVNFSSSRFHHGAESYNGYKLEVEGANKGKIVKVKEDGETVDGAAKLPLDFSITKNTLSLFISLLLLCVIFISIARRYTQNPNRPPKGLQSVLEFVILFIRDDVVKPSIGKNYEKYMPFLLTVFFFIFFSNLLGIVPFFPGGANLTGNIAITMVLALFVFLITSFSGNKSYWMHIINTPGVPWWLKIPIPLMPIVEIIGVITKPFVLMVRLFANISAGHIIILGFISLIFIFGNINVGVGYGASVIAVVFAVFMGFIELLVAFLQAYVFTLLSALYFGMATEEHKHQKEQAH